MDLNKPKILRLLREKGLRPTIARRQILTLLLEDVNHLSADEILEALRRNGFSVSSATIYQNLATLAETGLITRFTGEDGLMRYDSNLSPHHHIICTRCGKVMDVHIDKPGETEVQPGVCLDGEAPAGWKIDGVQMELRGICPECRREK